MYRSKDQFNYDTTMYRDDNGWLNTHMNNMNSEILI